ncbi:MAG: zinc-ribbon domain-containing protein, partial [Pseudomonadales bacterium]|nr:zinc-ribbon domain-containing protein [Pseudomonadales bacterium]
MAFQITQCPSCNSTFNTSPQMLEMAAGKVRCGACLYVFQAREHFVDVDSDEADESVFIGNDPEDFFDPAVFLTRSALQD